MGIYGLSHKVKLINIKQMQKHSSVLKVAEPKELYNISGRELSTGAKLSILKKVIDVWLTIWNKKDWTANEWYILDLFAGQGHYDDGANTISGSPLIFLEAIAKKKLRGGLKIKLFLVEEKSSSYRILLENINKFKANNPQIENIVKIEILNDDCNQIIDDIINKIKNSPKHPLFVFIDPTGLQIKKETRAKIVALNNPKDILLNYSREGVSRIAGLAKKASRGEKLIEKEIKTVKTLREFIGDDVDVINADDIKILEDYVSSFTSHGLNVIGYDMKYPDRNDIVYYLLFACKNTTVADIIKDIYARQKAKTLGLTLFGGRDFYLNTIFTAKPRPDGIIRRTLLYKTKVEYGDWTINHIVGCKHGCEYPCYAMMMARKFGWVKDKDEWRQPKLVANALELLDKEIPKYKDQIDFVHLCFMSDPFMYDSERNDLVPEIKELTLKIINRLNQEGIRVTTLTKGIYPKEIIDNQRLLKTNEYGITLVSLNEEFKKQYEPYSASFQKRIDSLKKLSDAGLNTWVSMEPYPTPELDKTAASIDKILDKISFVKKIIFGKLNYKKLNYDNISDSKWKNNDEFYKAMSQKIIDFCKKNNIQYHIKMGTPLSKNNTVNIFLV